MKKSRDFLLQYTSFYYTKRYFISQLKQLKSEKIWAVSNQKCDLNFLGNFFHNHYMLLASPSKYILNWISILHKEIFVTIKHSYMYVHQKPNVKELSLQKGQRLVSVGGQPKLAAGPFIDSSHFWNPHPGFATPYSVKVRFFANSGNWCFWWFFHNC